MLDKKTASNSDLLGNDDGNDKEEAVLWLHRLSFKCAALFTRACRLGED